MPLKTGSLTTGSLKTGSLKTGSLKTGSLKTGTLDVDYERSVEDNDFRSGFPRVTKLDREYEDLLKSGRRGPGFTKITKLDREYGRIVGEDDHSAERINLPAPAPTTRINLPAPATATRINLPAPAPSIGGDSRFPQKPSLFGGFARQPQRIFHDLPSDDAVRVPTNEEIVAGSGPLSAQIADMVNIFRRNPNVVAVVRRPGETRGEMKLRGAGYSDEAISALSGRGPYAQALAIALEREKEIADARREDARNQLQQSIFEERERKLLEREAAGRDRETKINNAIAGLVRGVKTEQDLNKFIESADADVLADPSVVRMIGDKQAEIQAIKRDAAQTGVELTKTLMGGARAISSMFKPVSEKQNIETQKAKLELDALMDKEMARLQDLAFLRTGEVDRNALQRLNELRKTRGMLPLNERKQEYKPAPPPQPPGKLTQEQVNKMLGL